jgi:histidine triad (HIT) family protein
MSDQCLFCSILAGTIPANVVHKDEHVTAIRDINPQAPTHILILTNRHLAAVSEAKASDEGLLGKVMLAAAEVARKEGLTDYRLVVNNGAGAGQSVFHVHVHLLGGRRMMWPPG